MSVTIVVSCPKHERYQGKLPPTADCDHCDEVYAMRQEVTKIMQTPRAQREIIDACLKSVSA